MMSSSEIKSQVESQLLSKNLVRNLGSFQEGEFIIYPDNAGPWLICSELSTQNFRQEVCELFKDSSIKEINFDFYSKNYESLIRIFFEVLCEEMKKSSHIETLIIGESLFQNILFFKELVQVLLFGLSENCSLEALIFSNRSSCEESVNLGQDFYKKISQTLSNNSKITTLCFGALDFFQAGNFASQWISLNNRLHTLEFYFLSSNEFGEICTALIHRKNITDLSLSNKEELNPKALNALGDLIRENQSLIALLLNETNLKSNDTHPSFCEGFKSNQSLRFLSISPELDYRDSKVLFEALDPQTGSPLSRNLKTLIYQGVPNSEAVATIDVKRSINILSNAIRDNRSLRRLDLSHLGLTFETEDDPDTHPLKYLPRMLVLQKNLTSLNLSNNYIGRNYAQSFQGFSDLSKVLMSRECCLITLNLSETMPNTEDTKILFEALDYNRSVTYLDYKFNDLSDGGFPVIMNFFERRRNVSLKMLRLDQDPQEKYATTTLLHCQQFFKALEGNHSLQGLFLKNVSVDYGEGVEYYNNIIKVDQSILAMLNKNHILYRLNFEMLAVDLERVNYEEPKENELPAELSRDFLQKHDIAYKYHSELLQLQHEHSQLIGDKTWKQKETIEKNLSLTNLTLYRTIYCLKRKIAHFKISQFLKQNSPESKEALRNELQRNLPELFCKRYYDININLMIFGYLGCEERELKETQEKGRMDGDKNRKQGNHSSDPKAMEISLNEEDKSRAMPLIFSNGLALEPARASNLLSDPSDEEDFRKDEHNGQKHPLNRIKNEHSN